MNENYCTAKMACILPKENKKEFLKLFYGSDNDFNYLRAWIKDDKENNNIRDLESGTSYITGIIEVKDSLLSALINLDSYEDERSLSLKEACIKYKVLNLTIFNSSSNESISYDGVKKEMFYLIYEHVDVNTYQSKRLNNAKHIHSLEAEAKKKFDALIFEQGLLDFEGDNYSEGVRWLLENNMSKEELLVLGFDGDVIENEIKELEEERKDNWRER